MKVFYIETNVFFVQVELLFHGIIDFITGYILYCLSLPANRLNNSLLAVDLSLVISHCNCLPLVYVLTTIPVAQQVVGD